MIYLFEGYALDKQKGELHKGAELIPLEPQVFDLLAYLVDNRDRLISKEELISSVWRGRIVSDSTLNSRINAARRAIDDDGKAQRLIRTSMGKGVRFVGTAEPAQFDKPASRMSIVVLPFYNFSGDLDCESLADAIVSDVTNELSRCAGSFVISRTTAFAYKGKPLNVKAVGLDLGVQYVLEGSVHRVGERVQADVQLTDTQSGACVWADRFEPEQADLSQSQSDMIGRIVRTTEMELVELVGRRIEGLSPAHLSARDQIMLGWCWQLRPRSDIALLNAQQAFERGLEQEPLSVDAKAGLATVLTEFVANGRDHQIDDVLVPPEEDLRRAEELLISAIEADRNHRPALLALGRLRRLQNRLIDSEIELQKVVALDRYNAFGWIQLGITTLYLGKPAEATVYFEKHKRLSIQSQNLFYVNFWLGYCHLLLGHIDEAINFFRMARVPGPRDPGPYLGLAASLGLRGDFEEGKDALREARRLRPRWTSLARLPIEWPNWNASPAFAALREKTMDVGLRCVGMPSE